MARLLASFCLLLVVVQLKKCRAQSPAPPSSLDLDYASLNAFLINQALDTGEGANPCNRSWVQCRYVPKWNGERRIRKLTISGAGLNGNIPVGTLGNLKALEYLNLSQNSLLGSIPEDVWALKNLSTLDLSNNRLSGNLSNSIGMARSLRRLDLSGNGLRGPVPARIGRLASLQFLHIGRNPLGGAIPPELFNCTGLRSLDLSDAQLTGTIPGALGDLFNLRAADFSSNLLTGPVPNISRLNNLAFLSLSNNSLSGGLPRGSLVGGLKALDLSVNKLQDVVSHLPKSWLSLEYLDLSSNPGLGAALFPSNLASFSALEFISISGSNFSAGTFPRIFNLVNLTYLDLGSSFVGGVVPPDVGKFINLEALDLARNNLSGWIPAELGGLSKLIRLDLSDNSLQGSIPSQLGNLTALSSLNMSGNHVSGWIPSELGRLSNLTKLDLSRNCLEGVIPWQLGGLTSLSSLDLSHNNLSGPIPEEWFKFNESYFEGNLRLCYGSCREDMVPPPAGAPTRGSEDRRVAAPMPHERYGLKTAVLIGVIAGGVVAVLVAVAAVCWLAKVARKAKSAGGMAVPEASSRTMRQLSGHESLTLHMEAGSWMAAVRDPNSVPVVLFEKPLLRLTLADLFAATSYFSKESQIAEGMYGPMYRGYLPNGLLVAIRIVTDKVGSRSEKEAGAQLEALGRVKHTNIVPLLGYCVAGRERILVHDFITNGDVHSKLHDLPEGISNTEDWSKDTWEQLEGDACGDSLGWETRHRIALGLARALSFLHHACSPHIVHTNVKASNILLDVDHEPYLADCGLPSLRAARGDQDWAGVGNTPGYVPPEYNQTSRASPRGDVYSFGVVLLELVTGKRPVGHRNFDSCGGSLVGWVRSLIRDNHGYRALDWKLTSKGPLPEMLEALRIGYLCTAESPIKRPSMQQVVLLLKDIQ